MTEVICSVLVCDLCHFGLMGRGFFSLSTEVMLKWTDKKDVTLRSYAKGAVILAGDLNKKSKNHNSLLSVLICRGLSFILNSTTEVYITVIPPSLPSLLPFCQIPSTPLPRAT